MYMTAVQQADFIKNHLGPAFHKANIDTKIITPNDGGLSHIVNLHKHGDDTDHRQEHRDNDGTDEAAKQQNHDGLEQ